jgi:hypothetical protein
MGVEKVMARYQEVYQALYHREPKELRDLGNNWVLVNGARMSVEELDSLTEELHREYLQYVTNRRNIVRKLLSWFART